MVLPSAAILAPAALTVASAYIIYGMTGFGASVVAVPVLTLFLPLRAVVPTMLVFDLLSGLLVGLRNRHILARDEVIRIVPFMLIGMVAGVTLLVGLPQRPLLLTLGSFVLAYVGWSLLLPRRKQTISSRWAAPLALAGGVFGALFGTGGPLYVVYLTRRIQDPRILRATASTLIFASGVIRLGLFSAVGLYHQPVVLPLAAFLLPFAMGGLFVGSRLHHRLPANRVIQAVWAVLVLSGLNLLWRNL